LCPCSNARRQFGRKRYPSNHFFAPKEITMKTLLTAFTLSLAALTTTAYAGNKWESQCESQAIDKKLSGTAKNKFIKECRTESRQDATASCAKAAADKRLNDAAKSSFVKKCMAEAKA
jgi:hypothetical protein